MESGKIYELFSQRIEDNTNELLLEKVSNQFQVILTFEEKSLLEDFIAKNKDLVIKKRFNIIPSVSVNLTKEQIKKLQNDPLIKGIEENQKVYLSMLDVIEKIELREFRESHISFRGKGINIGIIDNGINKNFDSISKSILEHYQLSKSQNELKEKEDVITHGTLMASILSNKYLDYLGNTIGIAPQAKIVDFDISNESQEYYFSDILEIFDIINLNKINLDIILIPLSTLHPSDGKDILSKACNVLSERGIIIVCGAGNFGPESYTIGSPGASESVITIGSMTKDGRIAYFSGRGPTLDERIKPDLCLFGSKIEIPLSSKIRIEHSGTSVSAAICVGLIAILKSFNKELNVSEIKKILHEACFDLEFDKISQGSGSTTLIKIFKSLGLYEEPLLTFDALLRRALQNSIQMIVIFIALFYLFYYYEYIRFLFI